MEKIDSEGAAPVIPGFTPVRELGHGATATVWLARRDADRGLFAVKCLMPGWGANPGVAEQDPAAAEQDPGAAEQDPAAAIEDLSAAEQDLRREVRILSVLSHRHLVKIHEVVRLSGSEGGGLGLVMDYAPGGSLGQLVAGRSKVSAGETVTVLTPVGQVLAYLHHNGFVHGDLSPGNVLFTELGKPLLTDLGLARMVGDGAYAAGSGTPGFTAPQDEDGWGSGLHPDRDVFALAALGWYCLTGSAPDAGPRRPPLSLVVPDVPPLLAAALEAGLHPDPKQRPSAAEFAAWVFRSAAAEPVDLSASVHASVLPRLLTRRQASESRRGNRGGFARGGRRGKRPTVRNPFRRFGRRASSNPVGISGRLLGTSALLLALAVGVGVLAAGTTTTVGWWPVLQSGASAGLPGHPGGGSTADASLPPGSEGSRGLQPIVDRTRSEDPVEAVHALAELRSTAIGSVSEETLGNVNVPGSPAAKADLETLTGLRSAGVVLDGFTTTLQEVVAMPSAGAGHAVVRVRTGASAYRERDPSGAIVASRAAAPPRDLQLVLLRTADGWRISEVQAAGS